jgi:hypothetical protein
MSLHTLFTGPASHMSSAFRVQAHQMPGWSIGHLTLNHNHYCFRSSLFVGSYVKQFV